jgi:hypothetical protein
MNFDVKFPYGFYNFHNGVDISDDEINNWIKKCIDQLENDKEESYASIASGNTMVIVKRYYDYNYEEDENRYNYEIIVTKGYWEEIIYNANKSYSKSKIIKENGR